MILEQIDADVAATMKERDPARKDESTLKIRTLRTVLAEAKSYKMDNRKEPEDTDMAGRRRMGSGGPGPRSQKPT